MVNKCINFIQSFIYPGYCLLCGTRRQAATGLCPGCHAELPLNHHCCPLCALPLPAHCDPATPCGECQRTPPPFHRCITPFLYLPPLDQLINGLKFRARLHNAPLLASLLAEQLQRQVIDRPDTLIPVPLHRTRLHHRGYNQALELARHLGHRLSIPLNQTCCIRQYPTSPQSGSNREQRHRNLRGAFLLRGRSTARHVALIDDVVTTGATVSELARTLKRGGIQRIDVWAVARTPRMR